MSEVARRLRAQKAYSTDPDYLERLARDEEARDTEEKRRGMAAGAASLTSPQITRSSAQVNDRDAPEA